MENISGTVNKAIDILELFLQKDGEFSLAELATLSGYNKSTAFRLVSTLTKRRFLYQKQRNGKYSLGLKMLDFSYAIRRSIKYVELAYLYLDKLSNEQNVSAYISVLDADSSLVLEEIAAAESMRINSPIGKRLPLHATACGKILLSSLSKEERASFYSRNALQSYTSKTSTDIAKLEKELEIVQKDGVAYGKEDYKLGLWAIAAPIYNGDGRIISAAGIVVPLSRTDAQRRHKLVIELKSCSAEISQAVGRIS